MTKTIYISGPITDNCTGLPREGWEKDFQDAEKTLRDMGFEVINPIEIAEAYTMEWIVDVRSERTDANPDTPLTPPRWFYLLGCIDVIGAELFSDAMFREGRHDPITEKECRGTLAGLYVIGLPEDIQHSFGTMTEINFALSANLPVFSRYYHGYQIDNLLRQITTKPTLAEIQRTLNK